MTESIRFTYEELKRLPPEQFHFGIVCIAELALDELQRDRQIMAYQRLVGQKTLTRDIDFLVRSNYNKIFPFKIMLTFGGAQDFYERHRGIRTIGIMANDSFNETKSVDELKSEVMSRI